MMGKIELSGMDFYSYHGCLPQERIEGARFLVDVSCECDISAAAESDNLYDTVDYAAVYSIVSAQMSVPSCLLEHVAGRILKALRDAFPSAVHISVKVSKEHPPVGGKAAWSSIEVQV